MNKSLLLFFSVAAIAAGCVFFSGVEPAHGANVYAQYFDNATAGVGSYGVSSTFALQDAYISVRHIQVALDITNDEQYGAGYYCPVAPNTGVIVFVYRNGNIIYQHCITSAEAAGKLGREAVYTFDDAGFEYDNGIGVQFTSQSGGFEAKVYGTNTGGGFYPYLVLGDPDGVGSPSTINILGQYPDGSSTLIPENGDASGDAVRFESNVNSFFASDTLAMQVEVEPYEVPFTGKPTATSAPVPSGGLAATTVRGLAAGEYHWRARAVDVVTGVTSAWSEYRSSGNIDFHVLFVREPVVIVPGIMGSVLDRVSDGVEVWPNAAKMALSGTDSYLDDLKLTPTAGETTPIAARDIIRQELGIPFYGPLIQTFVNDGYVESSTLFVAPYDWRLGAASSVGEIAPAIARAVAASPNGKVNVIAHSMGGLLMKQYLSDAATSSIDKLILVGVPQLGAPIAYKLLNYGDDLGMNWFGVGLNQKESKAIAQNMPGVYELLPSRRYIGMNGGYVEDFRNGMSNILNYDDTDALMLADATASRNAGLLVTADEFHSGIDEAAVNSPDVYNIVGCLRPTVTGFDLYDSGVVDIKSGTGDGTVPETSAMNLADGFKNYFVLGNETGIDHVGLVNDARPLSLMAAILGGSSTPPLPQGISSSLSDCASPSAAPPANETTIEFSAHGAATLNIYDSAGRHTGPLENGDVEEGVPGSSYETVGENSFISVPGGANYVIVDEALASGTLEMKAKEYDGARVAREATYLAISLASASTTATLNFSGFDGNMALALDENGDGTADESEVPSATLVDTGNAASSTEDIMPPAIALPAIPATVPQYSTTTLVFSAADSGSGIAITTAVLDGVSVDDGEVISFNIPGKHVFSMTAFDRAGNPRSGEIDFTVTSAPIITPTPTPTSMPTPTPTPTPAPSPTPTPIRTPVLTPVPAPTSTIITIPMTADAYITPLVPNENYGKAAALKVGGLGRNRILLSVDAATLKAAIGSSTIVSAHLIFNPDRHDNLNLAGSLLKNIFNFFMRRTPKTDTLDLYSMTVPWAEMGATWSCENLGAASANRKKECPHADEWQMQGSHAPFSAMPIAQATITGKAGSSISLDVTADVNEIIHGTAADDGWIMIGGAKSGDDEIDIPSRETKHGAALVVTRGS